MEYILFILYNKCYIQLEMFDLGKTKVNYNLKRT